MNQEIESKTAALEKIQEIESVEYQQKRTWYGKKTDQVVVDQEDFVQLKQLAEDHAKLKIEVASAQRDNQVLERKYNELQKEKNRYADQNHKIGLELHRHKTDIERVIAEKMSIEREKDSSKIQVLEKENRFLSKELEVTKHHVAWLEGEVWDKEKEIRELKERILALKETMKKMKDLVQETTRKLVLEAVGYARKSVYQATREWLRDNARDKVVPFLDDKKQIEKRANGIYADFVEEADRKGKSKDKDNELER
ncbi:hypothetical protein EVJ24_15025 [Exiguobacterium sp. SH1S21]|nr:hypothetical protein EVJ24_15025 [Exiguobacterium sp. SH1S21]